MADSEPQVENSEESQDVDIKKETTPNGGDSSTNNNTVDEQNGENGYVRKIDDVMSAKALWTTDPSVAIKLRCGDTGPQSDDPITVVSVFEETVKKLPKGLALAVKRNGDWVKWTYEEYYNDVRIAAKAFIKLGLEPYHSVSILGFNSPEWAIADVGCIFACGLATGVYTTNSPETCKFVLSDSKTNIAVVENDVQLQKILGIWDDLPHLKAIVQYTGELKEAKENVYTWKEFMAKAEGVPDSVLQERLMMQAPNKACSLVYTSGTTGNPKGVMLSHDNVTWISRQHGNNVHYKFGVEVAVSYLPLSHIAAQLMDIHIPIAFAGVIYFAQPDALKGTLRDTLKEARPTAFFGVPRVWEKFMEKMVEKGKSVTGVKKMIGTKAKEIGLRGVYAKMNKESMPFGWTLANMMVFNKVKAELGLDRCAMTYSGAAPISHETIEYFYSLNIPLLSVFGLSESTGPHAVDTVTDFRIGSVGKETPGCETKIADPDEDGNGEICLRGRHIFMGYIGNEEKTSEAIDQAGWLKSGDIGKQDKDGFLYVTGRIKELIITAGGENVAPVPIEANVKEALPCVSNCMVIGDQKKFLSMLITLKVEMNPDTGAPSDALTAEAVEWCKSVGSEATTMADVLDNKDKDVLKAIQAGVDKANEKNTSRATKIQKWSILPTDFSIPGGELGPTLKTMRPKIVKKYEDTIEAFYSES
ncbi:long-chain-fatty-acid--CoA ligase ACSBG2-like [Mizuhopecten yessoensis]|uniref:long-chain-fatty-acid--CoA ligase ACSBG2-like n=1 Tax=Mizuhopecten yessoensis TaxID=6573 RepID=UPI000B45893E|nr:long-chain-fatty-acid--CoA ligase ACSBG2-like [Mizuhopecten yessoensis]XP_021368564.1 long-chain-fatty-acid--CoA ligase ACSBG2-like [Mizuhopecten yessoensis]XP_021368565.1 long-chain-fatty-acid--CoA ligase ACSBG2-like [Mizuhopecten yessoensis]